MLQSLHVKNLALIDEAEVEFEKGLNILTGETGAGKSLLLGSVNLALGAKASRELLREDRDYALVELSFFVEDKKTRKKLEAMDLLFEEEGRILISRKIMKGRSISKINGETISAQELKRVTELLLDIHGQHEHQSLLYKASHLKILDEFAGEKASAVIRELDKAYAAYKEKLEAAGSFQMDEEQRLRECSFLLFEIEEIERAALREGEEEELESWYKKAANAKKIMESVSGIHDEISGEKSGGAGEAIGRAVRTISTVTEYDEELEPIKEQLYNIDVLLSDVSREIASYIGSLEFDEEQFMETQQRLDYIHSLEGKYGRTITDVFEYQSQKKERLEVLEHYQLNKEKAQKEAEEAKEAVLAVCGRLSEIRKKAALKLTEKIVKALEHLNFLEVRFHISVEKLETFGKNGCDEVEFLISTNPGEELRPLGKVASGGELSRIMLAIKTILSDKDGVDTLIFDEIDTGISGRTAQMVSEKLKEISRCKQVICITHLAQIAAMADAHFVIEKQVSEKKTVTSIRPLSEDESVEELARILGGAEITGTVRQNAKEMKELAKRTK